MMRVKNIVGMAAPVNAVMLKAGTRIRTAIAGIEYREKSRKKLAVQ